MESEGTGGDNRNCDLPVASLIRDWSSFANRRDDEAWEKDDRRIWWREKIVRAAKTTLSFHYGTRGLSIHR